MTVRKSWIYPWVNPWSDRKGVANGFESAVNALNPYAWYSAEYGQPKNVGYVQLDGTSGDYIWTADSVVNDISGNIEVVMRVKATDWTAAANQTLAGKYVTTGNQRSWRFYVSTTGNIVLTASADGTVVTSASIVPTVALVDNTWYWLRMRLQLTNGANSVATLDIAADQAEEPTVWTANGSQTAAIIASVFNSTSPVEIGSFQNGMSERLAGRVSRCIVRDGFGGEVLSDFDARRCYGDGYYNDYLDYGSVGNRYVPLTGRSGDYIYCADSSALDITGDIDLVVRVQAPSYTGSVQQSLIIKEQTNTQRSFRFTIGTTGFLGFTISSDGSTPTSVASDAPGLVDGTTYWLRVTRTQVDGITRFYQAADQISEPTSWTKIGSDKILLAGSAIFSSTSFLGLGIRFTDTDPLRGRMYRAIVRNGIGGTVVADFNANLTTPFGYGDVYGNGWIINSPKHKGNWTVGLPKIYDRSANNRAPVTFGAGTNSPKYLPYKGRAQVYFPGSGAITAPYLAQHDITGDIDIVARLRQDPNGAAMRIVSRTTATGWGLYVNASNLFGSSIKIGGSQVFASVPFAAWQNIPVWVRWTRVAATGIQTFYVHPDQDTEPTSWFLLGSSTAGGAGVMDSVGSQGVVVGAYNTSGGEPWQGAIYEVRVRNGIGGTTVADFEASKCGQSGYTDRFGNIFTVNRATTGRKIVIQSYAARSTKAVVLLGTDDYADVPAAAIPVLDTFAATTSVIPVSRRWHNPGTAGHAIFTTKTTSNAVELGTSIRNALTATDTTLVSQIGDGTTNDGANGVGVFGVREIITLNVGSSSPFVSININNDPAVTDSNRTTTSTTTAVGAGRIGAYKGGTGFIDMEFESLMFRNTLTTSLEHLVLVDLFGGAN